MTAASLGKPALAGDANLDGVVNFSDELLVSQDYGRTGQDWAHGDFDYNGIVNFDDLLILAQKYGESTSTAPLSGEFPASFLAQWDLALAEIAAYSVGDSAVAVDPSGHSIGTPTSWDGIPAGGKDQVNFTEEISISGTNSYQATIDVYDASGNLTDVYEPAVLDDDTNSATYGEMINPHTTYLYDSSGNEIAQITPDEQYAYQAWITAGNPGISFTGDTRFAYDAQGDMVQRTLPDGESESYTYDDFGDVLTHTDFDGNVTTYTYYATGADAGMAESVDYGAASGSGKTAETVSYTYDDRGRQYTVSDASGVTTYSYDAFGNQSVVASPEGVITYTYDPATGNLLETTTSNTDVAYGYDSKGELTTVTVKELNGTVLSTPLVTTYTYDAMGNKLSEALPNGVTTSYVYDGENDLTQLASKSSPYDPLLIQQYSYNAAGLRTGVIENQMLPNGLLASITTVWTYDNDDRLTSEKVSSGDIPADNYTVTYTYDLNSNQISRKHLASGTTETTTYTYNADDEMLTAADSINGTTTYTYDANGSQLTADAAGSLTTFIYDVRNKMIGFESSTTVATYVYDDAGDRVEETVNGTATYYLTDTANPTGYDQPIEAKSSPTATPTMTYVIGDRIEAQVDGSGNVTYLLADGHGDTRVLTDSSADVLGDLDFDALEGKTYSYGNTNTIFTSGDGPLDAASGLRMPGDGTRDIVAGQPDFIERDIPGPWNDNYNPVTLNAEIYGDGNPTNNTDPSGHYSLVNTLGSYSIGAGVEGGVGGLATEAEETAESVVDDLELTTELDDAVGEAYANDELGGGVANAAYPDEQLGLDYGPNYDSGQLVADHNPAQSIAELLGTDSEETQLLETLMNSRKGGLEGQIMQEIGEYLANGMSKEQVLEVIGPELQSLANSGFEIPVDPSLFLEL